MFDLYLFNTIVNTIWYIFTILFVLYRFTSFFSYIYNFSRFCGKIFTGIHYIYTSVTTKNVKYQNINIESQSTPKSTFQRFKETCKKKWRQLFGKESSTVIPKYENVFPLVETTTLHNSSGYPPNSSRYSPNSSGYSPNSKSYQESNSILERQLFNQKMTELIDDDSCYYDPNYQSISLSDDKIKFSVSNRLSTSLNDNDNFDIDNETLQTIRETMDELDKEEVPYHKVIKKVKFDTLNKSTGENIESESDSESEPLFHKQIRF